MTRLLPAVFILLIPLVLPAGDAKKDDLAASEKKLLELTNRERDKEKLQTLRWSPILAKVARAHAENMAKQKKEAHVLDGKGSFDRIKAAGYVYYRAGENVGSMTSDFALPDLMKAWMESKTHREQIMQGEFEEAGMGAALGEDGRLYFAQVFGTLKK